MTDEIRQALERSLAGFEQVSEGYGFDINTEEGLEQFSWGAEVRELRKDKARLDWLDASFCDGEARIVTVTNIWWRTPGESTCREAIDAAMGATENG